MLALENISTTWKVTTVEQQQQQKNKYKLFQRQIGRPVGKKWNPQIKHTHAESRITKTLTL